MLRAVWTLLTQLVLALIGQPVPGQTGPERRRNLQQAQGEPERLGAFAALRTVAREAFYALIGQPSPDSRARASRRKPRP
jgi:hypothetical protein